MKKKATVKSKLKVAICLCCCAVVGVLAIAGAVMHTQTATSSPDTATTAESELKTYVMSAEGSLAVDISDPAKMADMSQYVAIVQIDSLDGTDNYSNASQEFVSPYTYGRMTILNSIKGDLPVGDSVKFYRLGGAVSVDRYYAGLTDAEKERFDSIREANESLATADLIEVLNTDDIRIEAGKTYLVYMVDETAYDATPNTYAIIGFKGGLREVQLSQSGNDGVQTYSSGSGVKVLNNFTNSWDDLSDVIPER